MALPLVFGQFVAQSTGASVEFPIALLASERRSVIDKDITNYLGIYGPMLASSVVRSARIALRTLDSIRGEHETGWAVAVVTALLNDFLLIFFFGISSAENNYYAKITKQLHNCRVTIQF